MSSLIKLFALADAEEDKGPRADYDVVLEHDRAITESVERQIEERWAEIESARARCDPASPPRPPPTSPSA